MKRSLLLFFLISYLAGHAQDRGVLQGANARIFELSDITDTIQFLKLDADTTVRKPALIVLQGSLPIPLAIEYPSGYHFTSFPFALGKSTETFHILNISMPFVPLLARPEELSANGSLREVPTNYNKANHLQTYVRRTNKVIEFLRKQAWVEPGEIILFGHSQGGYVALKVAGNNPHISKIGLSACNPFGRFDQYIRRKRLEEQSGKISSEETQAQIEEYYEWWRHISDNRHDDNTLQGDTEKAAFSFSENFLDDILGLRIPLYITYGTRDIGSLGCDYLPIELERIGKKDYVLKAYPGLGHNYEEIDERGTSNYDKMFWDEVFQEFIRWAE